MIEHLKAKEGGALAEAKLEHLGHINVVCGKNNSGKSTLLRALSTASLCSVGAKIPHEKGIELAHMYAEGTVFRNGDKLNTLGSKIPDIFVRIFKGKSLWYLDEVREFVKLFKEGWTANREIRQYGGDEDRVSMIFRSQFPAFPAVVLVPPNRALQLTPSISTDETIAPSGQGLVNRLFFLKNQEEGTSQRTLFDQVLSAFRDISAGYSFEIASRSNNQLGLMIRNLGGQWVSAEQCGLGLQDLLVILYFSLAKEHQLVLVEEPETHMHPEMQRKLLGFLGTEAAHAQFFFSSHSNVFVDPYFTDRVFLTTFRTKISTSDETGRAQLLGELGYQVTDNLVSDLVILVEGPRDVPVYEELLNKVGVFPRYSIKFWPLGGDIMDKLDLTVFVERYKIIAVIDADPGSKSIRDRFARKCEEVGIVVHRLKRYAIENYFTLDALTSVFSKQMPTIEELRPDEPVEGQLGFSVKKRGRDIAKAMALSDVEDTDLGGFLNYVKNQCERG